MKSIDKCYTVKKLSTIEDKTKAATLAMNVFLDYEAPDYGAAQCLGTVLTDAPLETIRHEPLEPKCGHCNICVDICEKKVLKGRRWTQTTPRDKIVDVYGCSTCLKCLVHCPGQRNI